LSLSYTLTCPVYLNVFISLASNSSSVYTLLSSLLQRPPTSTLFPYTTLFRSALERNEKTSHIVCLLYVPSTLQKYLLSISQCTRSEEHTSELQSRFDLVCRLLLEKKNICIYYA